MTVCYSIEGALDPAEFTDVLHRSTLAARRPADDAERIARMVGNANLIVGARDGGRLIGVARSITDFSYCCYLSDLAVDQTYQGRGIGTALIRRTQGAAGPEAMLLLLSAPGAMSYYEHIGMRRLDNAWGFDR